MSDQMPDCSGREFKDLVRWNALLAAQLPSPVSPGPTEWSKAVIYSC